jgi:glycosyltransferase involved in cell wall biosynthesis
MKICLVGGIFDRDAGLQAKHLFTPETILRDGFQAAGVDMTAVGHSRFKPSDEFDIVHVHHFGKAAMQMATSLCRARFVFTGHNGMIVTGYERSKIRRSAFAYVLSKADALVALSKAETAYYRNAGTGDKVHLIPNGIPAEVFRVRTDDVGTGARYRLLYVGQLIDCKGVNFLLQAVRQLRERWDIHLRLVYHNATLETEYKVLAQELGIADRVEFVGILGPDELAEEYRQADVLVLPSLAECLPSVVTESLLCGTPVVATAVCGVPEQVGKYGRVVTPGDAPALAEAIGAVLQDRPRFRALSGEMRAYAADKFNTHTMVEAHLALYRDLIDSQSLSFHGKGWLDPLVRLAVKAYWARRRRVG